MIFMTNERIFNFPPDLWPDSRTDHPTQEATDVHTGGLKDRQDDRLTDRDGVTGRLTDRQICQNRTRFSSYTKKATFSS